MIRIRIKKIELVAKDYAKHIAPLQTLVAEYGCKVVLGDDGTLSIMCKRRAIPVREWLKIPDGPDEATRRKGDVYRRTGRPWDPVQNPDVNISFSGFCCADDR